MKALFIGGTGTISSAVSKLAVQQGWELYLLNRGHHKDSIPEGVKSIIADINDENAVAGILKEMCFDVVADFITFVPAQIERNIRLFAGKTKQFIYISSASVYQKPLSHFVITESTPLANPYWQYSQDKISCEEILMSEYRNNGLPITIVRPSHTYDERSIPLAVHGRKGPWQVVDRIRKGKPVLVHGDGSSLWTVTHSSDFAKAFVGLMGNHAAIGEAVQITSDEVLTWNEIYDCIGSVLNMPVKKVHISSEFIAACDPEFEGGLIGDKANSVCFDNSKIKRLVPNYVATIRFDQGVRISIENFLAHPELQVPDEEFDRFCDNIISVREQAVNMFKKRNVSMLKR